MKVYPASSIVVNSNRVSVNTRLGFNFREKHFVQRAECREKFLAGFGQWPHDGPDLRVGGWSITFLYNGRHIKIIRLKMIHCLEMVRLFVRQ